LLPLVRLLSSILEIEGVNINNNNVGADDVLIIYGLFVYGRDRMPSIYILERSSEVQVRVRPSSGSRDQTRVRRRSMIHTEIECARPRNSTFIDLYQNKLDSCHVPNVMAQIPEYDCTIPY